MNPLDWVAAGFQVMGLQGFSSGTAGVVPSLWNATGIAVLAGVSTLAGHSAILFLNRVRGWRFWASFLLGGLFMILLYAAQGVLLWVVAPLVTGTSVGIATAASIAMASTAPMMLGITELFPHLGMYFGRVLQGWTLLCLWSLTLMAYASTWWQSLIATALAWLAMQLASRLLSAPISWATGHVIKLVTGSTLVIQAHDVLAGSAFVPVHDPSEVAT